MKYITRQESPVYLTPEKLASCLKAMAILDIIMVPEEDEWLRLIRRYDSGGYKFDNGSGDEIDILFEENGIFIKGFDHENELNQFASDEWDETFFQKTYAGVPQNLLDIYKDEECLHSMTFCMWYDFKAGCWMQNITEGIDEGKNYLLGFICENAMQWTELGEDYYGEEINCKVVEKVYSGQDLTTEDICIMLPGRDAENALEEIITLNSSFTETERRLLDVR
ncbi:MAG: hypothetical protein HFH68_10305 [Lachnospiraceae bacterium]|nr:hypothetical protein [Lachnospiraceae bacterium]